jgi:hypothetical protein
MASVNIVFVNHLPSADPGRNGMVDTLIVFTVDAGPPDSVILPMADPTEKDVLEAIARANASKTRLTGATLTLP